MTTPATAPLLCELHAHSTWSDGVLSIPELVDLYGCFGFDVLCVTDHVNREDDPWLTPRERRLRRIKRKEEARAIYDAARRQGKLAGLLDQSRPNVFVQSVANIPPNAKVEVEIQYVETLKFEAGRYEFVFPMVVGPRYSPKHNPGAFQNPKYAAQGTRAGHDISLAVKLDAGLPVDAIDSTTHEVVVENRTAAGAFIKLRNQNEIPNKDFILRWDVTGRKINDALLTHRGHDGKGYFTFVLAPPDSPSREDVTPKELVFVIDTSGSISDHDLSDFFAEIHGLWKNGAQVTVIECDAAIHNTWEYRGKLPHAVGGRGGTSFDPAFAWLRAYRGASPFDGCIYLTDGVAPEPTIHPPCKLLWVILPGGTVGSHLKWGRAIKLPG